jgi:hypothetical protein
MNANKETKEAIDFLFIFFDLLKAFNTNFLIRVIRANSRLLFAFLRASAPPW